MTTAAALLDELRHRGITVRLKAGGLLGVGPAEKVTPELVSALKTHKPRLLKLLGDHEALPPTENWDSALARALVDEVLAEQEALNTRWPWPETRAAWEALWLLGDQIDDAYLAEDLPALRDAIAKWRERARQSP